MVGSRLQQEPEPQSPINLNGDWESVRVICHDLYEVNGTLRRGVRNDTRRTSRPEIRLAVERISACTVCALDPVWLIVVLYGAGRVRPAFRPGQG